MSSGGPNRQSWTRPWNSIQVSHMDDRAQELDPYSSAFPDPLAGSWVESRAPGAWTSPCNAGIASNNLKRPLNLKTTKLLTFQSSCSILFQQYLKRDPVFLYPCQHLILSLLKIIVVLIDGWQYLIVIFVYISLMASDLGHPFMCSFNICLSSLYCLCLLSIFWLNSFFTVEFWKLWDVLKKFTENE